MMPSVRAQARKLQRALSQQAAIALRGQSSRLHRGPRHLSDAFAALATCVVTPGTTTVRGEFFSVRSSASAAAAAASQFTRSAETTGEGHGATGWAVVNAQRLCNEHSYPLGSFTQMHYEEAKDILEAFVKNRVVLNAQVVNAPLDLLERLCREPGFSEDATQVKRFCDPRFFNPLFNRWKEASLRNEKVILARDLVKKLQTMSTHAPAFKYDIATISMIINVVIKQAHPNKAPLVADSMLEFVKDEAEKTKNKDLAPNVFLYNQVLSAWGKSRFPQAPQKMETLMEDMISSGISPSLVSYNIVLRFWSGNGMMDKVEKLLETMKRNGLELNLASLSTILYGYTMTGQTPKAVNLLQRMLDQCDSGEERDVESIGVCAQNILAAYLRAINPNRRHSAKNSLVVDEAEALLKKLERSGILSSSSYGKLVSALMDIYILSGNIDRFVISENPDEYECALLMRAYAKSGKVDEATDLVHKMQNNPLNKPDTSIFNRLIYAWAESTRPDAVEQAFAILKLMDQDDKCLKLGIRPNIITFHGLLQCLAASKRGDAEAARRANAVLDDMECRYLAGDESVKPNKIAYTLALKICLRAGDLKSADAVMKRMEQSDTPPDVRTYSEILNHYSKIGTPAAAERTEQILAYMKDLAKANPLLKPNLFSFNIALNAWIRSGDPNATGRSWSLYEQMLSDGIKLDFASYCVLITFLSKSNKRDDLKKADLILKLMENSASRPDAWHYCLVMKSFINAGDVESAANTLLRSVEQYVNGKNDGGKPSAFKFNLVSYALIRSGDLEKATLFLEKMQGLRDTNQIPVGPDLRTYEALHAAWKKSAHQEKDRYISKIENQMAAMRSLD